MISPTCDSLYHQDFFESFDEKELLNMDLFPNLAELIKEEKDVGIAEVELNSSILDFDDFQVSDELDSNSGESVSEYVERDGAIWGRSQTNECVQLQQHVNVVQQRPQNGVRLLNPRRDVIVQRAPSPLRGKKVIVLPVMRSAVAVKADPGNDDDRLKEKGEPCGGLSKNAIAARENRLRKKRYVKELETSAEELSSENRALKARLTELETRAEKLETEVSYLRNVLLNVDEIKTLVRAVHGSTPKAAAKRAASPSLLPGGAKRKKPSSPLGGVCLHVNGGKMALEFCAECSVNAVDSWKQEDGEEP